MKEKMLYFIVCPSCKGDFNLSVFLNDAEEIIEGGLTCCLCGKQYPVIDGIPRLLSNTLANSLAIYHKDFFEKHPYFSDEADDNVSNNAEVLLKLKTLKSFSFQWNTFGEIYTEYGSHWKDYLPNSIEETYFSGKTGLDAGCGFGRHILRAAEAGAEMVGIDLSEAVRAAYINTRHNKSVYIVQGDIYNPPFREGIFDFIYSLGVLHHLPDPEKGFHLIAKLLRRGQDVFIWCYDNDKPRKNSFYEFLRRYTTRLDYRTLYVLTYIVALGVRIFLNYPTLLGKRLGLHDMYYPYEYYLTYPFRVLHADLFDLFAVPSTKYYDRCELEKWFMNADLAIKEVKHSVSGWTVYGSKNNR